MQIRIDTEHAREAGRRLISESDRLAEIGHELQNAISSLDTGAWDGVSRARAEPMLGRVRPESERMAQGLDILGRKLVRVADVFEQEDNTAARNLEGMPWVDFQIGGGSVLGVATAAVAPPAIMLASLPLTGDRAPDLSRMSWADRFAYAETLPGQIQALEDQQRQWETQIAQDDLAVANLDHQIQELQAQRDALQEEAGDFWNKIKRDPDGWRWGFDDGLIDAPWRTQSDALEDEIARCDHQIQELQAQRDALVRQRQEHQRDLDGVNQQLTTLRQSQTELNSVIRSGIPLDGPSPKYPYFPAGNCTKYAASKRNVPCSGHAYQWNEQARAGGYEVGNYPVKGSVMVMEAGVKGAHVDYGHVAIVESVETLSDGKLRVWYTDNHNMDPANPASRIVDPGTENISFIYDTLPDSTSVT
jgi:WXG100 family type VII secretion target